jgi:N-acyl-D-aspartate/D-glutamate deacylase
MYDVVVKNGLLVDGSGAPARRADVAVRGGRIVDVGEVDGAAASVIDASGLVVTPGFIDLHTHYDPHVMWDPGVTPSSIHGVTTIVGGNCGFTIAPIVPDAAEYLLPMLAKVEGMPLESLEACLDMGWGSFGSWLARLDGSLAVNAGFLVGHSTLRRLVMGADAVGHEATAQQVERMIGLLHASLEEGALGFSSSRGAGHTDHRGDPVPSRWAHRDELLALSRAVKDHPGTVLEFIPGVASTGGKYGIDQEIMTAMSAAARRSLNWNLLVVRSGDGEIERRAELLRASDHAEQAGGQVRALTLPMALTMRLNFMTGVPFDGLPGWKDTFALPPTERCRALRDPELRQGLRNGAQAVAEVYGSVVDWANYTVLDVSSAQLTPLVSRRLGDIASERGADVFDTLLDIAIDDELRTGFQPMIEDSRDLWEQRLQVCRDRRTIVGGSDSGAHLDMLKTFSMHTTFIQQMVREQELMPLEEAIQHITDVPARFYGLKNRGRLEIGYHADVVAFDPESVGPGVTEFRADMPAGGRRVYSEPTGIAWTMVNGVVTSRNGRLTGATPGTVLRSGTSTQTVEV